MDKKIKKEIAYSASGIVKLIIGIILIFPIIFAFGMAFMTPDEITSSSIKVIPNSFTYFQNFIDAFRIVNMTRYLINSLIIAFLGTVGRIVTATLAAFAFSFYEFKGKKLLFGLIMGAMMVPGDVLLFTNYLTILKVGMLNTYIGIIVIYLVYSSYVFMMRQNMLTIPRSLYEAAIIDGCSNFKFLLTVVIPLSKSIIMAVFLSSFVGLWNIYLWPLLITNDSNMRTIQVGVSMLSTADQVSWGPIMAATLVATLPIMVLFVISQKFIVRGLISGAVKG